MVWGGYAEFVCLAESLAIKVPQDVDPAVLVSVIFPYMIAYQLIRRAAKAQPGETMLYLGAAGRVGVAVLKLAEPAGITVYGTASGSDCHSSSGSAEWPSTTHARTFCGACAHCLAAESMWPSTESEDRWRSDRFAPCGAVVA
jgi:hypothetical protein